MDENKAGELRAKLRGKLLLPTDQGYDEARKIFNGMIDKRPAAIVRCAGVADVVNAVNFARQNGLIVSVKGGGHSVAGNAVCDGGLMIDLSGMKSIWVDSERRVARAEPGVTWSDFDHETSAFGLATTGGLVSSTGIAGFTLGGGHGWLMGLYGRACDNLVAADVVTADGKFLHASESENTDLFWALRGGGGNFGVVTSFEYKLYRLDHDILGGFVAHPLSKAKEVLQFVRDFAKTVPDEVGLIFATAAMPDGTKVAVVAMTYVGDVKKGEEVVAPVRKFGPPIADHVGPMKYTQLQKMLDPMAPPGMHHYWKSGFFNELSDEAIETIYRYASTVPSPLTQIHVEFHHGKAARIKPEETAFAHRGEMWNLNIVSSWQNPSETQQNLEWTRNFFNDMKKFLSDRAYSNFMSDGESDRFRSAFGENYDRLARIKAEYDPNNFFRLNQNIKPLG